MKAAEIDLQELAARTNRLREQMRLTQQRFAAGFAEYEDVVAAAKAFCTAFDEYHKAKYGKGKKLDWRAVIR